jgi:ribosome-associated protein
MPPDIDIIPGIRIPLRELKFLFTRSAGPGGQNVNKVSTRVELLYDLASSSALTDEQKARARSALGARIGPDGVLRVQAQNSRSQWQNRLIAAERLAGLLRQALRPRKKRVASRPTRGSREERFRTKKKKGTIKRFRGRVSPED